MQNPYRHLLQTSQMQALRSLISHRKLLVRLTRSKLRFTPNPSWRSSPIRYIHHGSWKGRGFPEENRRAWATYDPITDQLVNRLDGVEGPEEKKLPSARKCTRRTSSNASEEDSSDQDEHSKVWTFYNPVADQLVTHAAGDDSLEEEPTSVEDSPKKRSTGRGKKLDVDSSESSSLSPSSQAWSSVVRRKTGKTKVHWVCESCGATPGQWWGACTYCGTIGSVKEFSESEVNRAKGVEVSEVAVRSWLPQRPGMLVPQSLADVNRGRNQSEWRIPLSGQLGMEVARVLGGGIVPGSLVLVGGDPGVGKSTLLLQIAGIIAQGFGSKGPTPVVYVSGEESIEQIGNRADRMRITSETLFLYSSTDIEDILDKIQALSPQALIVDSIQTVYLRGVTGSAGNIMQVKECTSALLRFAKQTNIPVILIGHVTKTGDIAGPRILEHIVDAVLYMEGERYSSYRLLRSVKNRFGSTDELGVFEMSESGLQAVSNPSEMFLSEHYSDSDILAGLAVAVVVDGSRTFLIEIQALCVSGSSSSRQVNGIRESRADMIISVLMKQAGIKLYDNAIFLNVVSGFKLTETAGDLAIAAAICSSFLEFPLPNDVAFVGEIGLGGELRAVPRIDKRVVAVAKLGYKKCVIPKTSEKLLTALNLEIEIVGCRTLKEVINTIFK